MTRRERLNHRLFLTIPPIYVALFPSVFMIWGDPIKWAEPNSLALAGIIMLTICAAGGWVIAVGVTIVTWFVLGRDWLRRRDFWRRYQNYLDEEVE